MTYLIKKAILILVALGVNVSIGFTQKKENVGLDNPTDIFLLIGQSNMAGVAYIEALDTTRVANAFLFNDRGEWEVLKNTPTQGLNRYSTVRKPRRENRNLNPGYTFAKKLVAYTGRQIGIVSNARGGTRISWWQKGYSGQNDFDLYENAVARTRAALQTNPEAKIRGILWHQGEGDNSIAASASYLRLLAQLVADLRADLGDPDIPFIAGEVGQWKGRGLGVNPKIRMVKDSVSYADYVTSDGLTSMNLEKNDPHFDTYSQRVLGGRYADKAFELIYKGTPSGVTLYNDIDFKGYSVLLISGDYSIKELESMGIPIESISSLTVGRGYSIQFFIRGNNHISISKNNKRLSIDNIDAISSVRVTEK